MTTILTPTAEHLVLVDHEVGDPDLTMVVATGQGLDIADDLPPVRWDVHQEGGISGLRKVGVILRASDEDGELRTARTRD